MDGGSRPSDSFLSTSEWLDHAEGASTRFMAASGGGLPGGGGNDGPGVCLGDGQTEAYLKDTGHDGPGVCLGDGQTEAEGVLSQGRRGDALLRRMYPHLT